MSASSAAEARDPSAKEEVFRKHFELLQDCLLLSLRDGAWHLVADLAAWLAPRVTAEFAVHRYQSAGGLADKKLAHKSGEGQKLVLADLLDTLRGRNLLAVRATEAGEEVRSTPLDDDRFEIDPEFEHLLPRAADEVRKLEERLLAEGPRDPLVVWKGQRKLVDGHTRFRFFSLLGRRCPVVEIDFADRSAAVAWVYDTHYGRRSYSAEMKSYVRGKQYLARKQRHGGARKKASAHSGHLKTADAVAAEYGVGRYTVRRDAAFAEALDTVAAHCGDEVRQMVLSRAVRWTRGDMERLAKADAAAAVKVVRAALVSGTRPRLPARTEGGRQSRETVGLPLGKPADQVKILVKVLGRKGLARLHKALGQFLGQK